MAARRLAACLITGAFWLSVVGCGSDEDSPAATAGTGGRAGSSGSGGSGARGGNPGADAGRDSSAAGGSGGSSGSAGAAGAGDGSSGTAGSGGSAGMSCTTPQGGVVVQPGSDVQAAVDAQAAGTSFLLAAGVHRMQSVRPKKGDTFYGELAPDCSRSTTMSGARVLSSWSKQGNVWQHGGQTQQGQVHGECETGWERCNRPEDLFVDGVPLHHVGTPSEVGAGEWHFDYDADSVYLGDDPAGHVVEIGVTRVAFSPSADDVTIKNLIVEKYAIPPQMGAIGDQYPKSGWQIENNEVRLNHGTGINATTNSRVIGNYVHHNGQKGVGGGGDDVLFEANEIAYNNFAHVSSGWEAGGSKFAQTNRLVVRRNCIHHNDGPGLWTDIDNRNTLYEKNVSFANQKEGIFHEISFDAVIRNNLVGDNGRSFAWLYGAQILVSTSQNVEVHSNVVEVPATYGNGISIIWQNRPPWRGTGNNVHDNDVTFLSDAAIWQNTPAQTGAAADFSPATTEIFQQNSMNDNHYHATNAQARHFAWANGAKTFAELKAAGQEAAGSLDASIVPKSWSCALVPQ